MRNDGVCVQLAQGTSDCGVRLKGEGSGCAVTVESGPISDSEKERAFVKAVWVWPLRSMAVDFNSSSPLRRVAALVRAEIT